MHLKIAVPLLLLFTIACQPPILVREYHRADAFQPGALSNQSIGIVISSKGEVTGFRKAFAKVYKDNESFIEDLKRQTVHHFSSSIPGARVLDLSSDEASLVFSAFSRDRTDWVTPNEELNTALAGIAREHDVDMLLVVSRWQIKEHWETHTSAPMFNAATNTWNHGGSHQTKLCDVVLEGGLLQVDGTPLYYGDAKGTARVFLFTFQTTLKEAIAKAVAQYRQMIFDQTPARNIRKS